jgi:hypothetical protein
MLLPVGDRWPRHALREGKGQRRANWAGGIAEGGRRYGEEEEFIQCSR